MTKQEFGQIGSIEYPKNCLIQSSDLINNTPRTLVYGYDKDRNTYHLYLKHDLFYSLWYDSALIEIRCEIGVTEIDARHCSPNKRVYPEACDFEFAKLLIQKGVYLTYTFFNEKRLKAVYYGLTIEDFKK